MRDWEKAYGSHESVIQRYRELMHRPQEHIKPLAQYAQRLRDMGRGQVPDFDPYSGGTNALVLFLFEKPGPKAAESGFISTSTNPDPSARHTVDFMRKCKIPRSQTVVWNVIPWWNGRIRVTNSELRAGVQQVEHLIQSLPNLRVIVLSGRNAQRAGPHLARSGFAHYDRTTGRGRIIGHRNRPSIFSSYHPSMQVRNRYPDKFASIRQVWLDAWTVAQRRSS